MAYVTVNLFTGEKMADFPESTDQAIAIALDSAHGSFGRWCKCAITERMKVLARAADLLRERQDDYAHFYYA